MSAVRTVVFPRADNEWGWRIIAANGEPIASSGEGFTRPHDARRAVVDLIGSIIETYAVLVDEPGGGLHSKAISYEISIETLGTAG